jgi:iron(II)-dependent oxidoreductase
MPIDPNDIRRAAPGAISLALMDARNRSLHLATLLATQHNGASDAAALALGLSPLAWELGYLGWYQEYWIARNMRRALGPDCPAAPTRLSSVLPDADRCWNPALSEPSARWRMDLPDMQATRGYLLQTLEATLELLDKAPMDDAALYFYRLVLQHEDLAVERLCLRAQALGLALELPAPPALAAREPLLLPATRWTMGWNKDGFAFDNELPAHEVVLPAYEIDAQSVSWAQYVEFVDDGGYDRTELWSPEGWAWLERETQASGRRGPRHVEQIGVVSGAVMLTRFGRPTRMAATQPALHVTWWEAEAWCRWAGRRLPFEAEWEAAAHIAARLGFTWGGVWEWTGSMFRGYPGFKPGPDREWSLKHLGKARVARGASFATHPRIKHPKFRNFLAPQRDDAFVGFRSCAL